MSEFTRRILLAVLVAGIALPLLDACGKKGRLESPPEGQEYPRTYPDPSK